MKNPKKIIITVFLGLAFVSLHLAMSYCVSHGPAATHMDAGTISFVYCTAHKPSPPPSPFGQKYDLAPPEFTVYTLLSPEQEAAHPRSARQNLLPSRASPA